MTFILWVGAAGALLFPVIFLLDGWTRPGYRPAYHPVSALALGPRGWIQTANFLLCGAAIATAGIALVPALDSVLLALVIGGFGLSLMASGAFPMDPIRGYPPGTPDGDPREFSLRHTLHDWAGMFVFALAPLAALIAAWAVPGTGWRIYSGLTAAVGTVAFLAFGQAWERDHPRTGLVQRLAIIVSWVWLGLLFLRAADAVP
ncbi:DUF998 domain-containing protein [Ruania zhangjianzhongii]|uniref:DUF998 domain-containing protein n=1 Tax=Ruania zhangjianzhongii TaxID=2603206 RepID=UPI0011CAAC53|nr:DUF998 domain-containing protein [Ruania zhangjianzhongii]